MRLSCASWLDTTSQHWARGFVFLETHQPQTDKMYPYLTLKHSRLTRKWTLADMRRLDCSIVKTNDQRFGDMKGKGKEFPTDRLGKTSLGRRPERTLLGGH